MINLLFQLSILGPQCRFSRLANYVNILHYVLFRGQSIIFYVTKVLCRPTHITQIVWPRTVVAQSLNDQKVDWYTSYKQGG